MPGIGPLLAQPTVLLRDQVHHERWMLMDQGEKTGAVQPNQGQRCQRLGIPAVALIRRHQVLIKKQLPDAVTDTTPSTTVQLDKTLFDDINGISKVSMPEHQGARGQGPPVDIPMLTDQCQWCLGIGACAHAPYSFMRDQLSPDISRMVANQSTIQLQLLLAVIALQPMQRR